MFLQRFSISAWIPALNSLNNGLWYRSISRNNFFPPQSDHCCGQNASLQQQRNKLEQVLKAACPTLLIVLEVPEWRIASLFDTKRELCSPSSRLKSSVNSVNLSDCFQDPWCPHTPYITFEESNKIVPMQLTQLPGHHGALMSSETSCNLPGHASSWTELHMKILNSNRRETWEMASDSHACPQWKAVNPPCSPCSSKAHWTSGEIVPKASWCRRAQWCQIRLVLSAFT